jgi:hypothetical protein
MATVNTRRKEIPVLTGKLLDVLIATSSAPTVAVLSPVVSVEFELKAPTAVQVALSKSTQLSPLMLAKEQESLSSTVPKTLLAVKSAADPSTTTTPFPEKRLFVKHVSEIVTFAPSTLARAYPLPFAIHVGNVCQFEFDQH